MTQAASRRRRAGRAAAGAPPAPAAAAPGAARPATAARQRARRAAQPAAGARRRARAWSSPSLSAVIQVLALAGQRPRRPTTPSRSCGCRRSSPRCCAPTPSRPTASSGWPRARRAARRPTTTRSTTCCGRSTDAAEAQPADRAVLADLNAAVARLHHHHRPGPRQQPAGLPGRHRLPQRGQRRACAPTADCRLNRQGPRRRQLRPRRRRARRPAPAGCSGLGLARARRAVLGQPARSPSASTAGSTSAWPSRPPRSIVLTLLTAAVASKQNSDNEATCATAPTARAFDEATARTAANDAKANESQGLINRGLRRDARGGLRQRRPRPSSTTPPRRRCGSGTPTSTGHDEVRELDDGGDWDDAVALATSGQDGDPTALLDAVDARPRRP